MAPANPPSIPGPRESRRSSAEVRTLTVAAARKLFAQHGYRGTSTRDIAAEAGVTAAAIYRHFGNKVGLFETAVEEPLHQAMDGFLRNWEFLGPEQDNNAAAAELFLTAVLTLLRQNRDLLGAYLYGSPQRVGESVLSRELGRVVDRVQRAVSGQGLPEVDVPVVVRSVTAMLLALVLHEDALFPPDDRPDDTRIMHEIVPLILRGIEARGPTAPASGR